MLRPITDGLYEATADLYMPGGLHFPVRMTVVVLPDGGLVLHSPIAVDDALAAALAELGPVRHLVAPNRLHHLYFGDVAARYPDAETWGAPGLAAKRPDLTFARTLGAEPLPFADVLAPHFIAGIPWMSETAFFHRPTGTLLVTDLFFHLVEPPPNWMSRLFFSLLGLLGRPKQSPIVRLQTRDKAAAAGSAAALLDLPIERVVPAHGPVLSDDARGVLATVLGPMVRRGGRQLQTAA